MSTISDVAKRAGVSTVTVSRVINGERNVNTATREKVERAIAELGYVPNVVARSLRSKRTRTLALVLPDITNVFWTTAARGVEDAAQSLGYSVLLCNTDENPAKQQRYLQVVASQRVDGVIIAPCDADAGNLSALRNRDIPTVIVDRRVEGWDVDSVSGDSVAGAHALVRHLLGAGHRRIAAISGPLAVSTADDRIAGYRLALEEAGILFDERLVKRGEFRAASGERLTCELLDEGLAPTAVFAANNVLALGVLKALGRRGLRVPQDLALVCFDDLPETSLLLPFLTVVAQPAYDMGVHAAQLLLSRLGAETALRPRHVVLPGRLVIRYSCGSRMAAGEDVTVGLPLIRDPEAQSILVRPLGTGLVSAAVDEARPADYDKSDVDRLLRTLRHAEAGRVPHLEFEVNSRAVYEYVLEREPGRAGVSGGSACGPIRPGDQVEFARRLGMDAVTCRLDAPEVALADRLNCLERYLWAAQGTGVGVVAGFASFFGRSLAESGRDEPVDVGRLGQAMDVLVQKQEKVIRAVCDRFAGDLAFVLIHDRLAGPAGPLLPPDVFEALFVPRMQRLLAPALEHGKLIVLHTPGRLAGVLPLLHRLGVAAVHPVEPACNDLFGLKQQWAGKMAFAGGLPALAAGRGRAG